MAKRRPRGRARQSNAAALIDRFVPENTPLGRLDEGNVLLRAAGGNEGVAKFLALLARKESSFGAAGSLPRGNNYWGWGIHLGPSVNSAPSVEAMARKVAEGLKGRLYRGSGLTSTDAIINRYAPPSENNTSLYQSQIRDWAGQLGLNPRANIFAQGNSGPLRTAQSTGAPVARDPGAVPSSAAPGSLPQISSIDGRKLMALLAATQKQVLAGQMPGPAYGATLNKIAQAMRASVQQQAQQPQAQMPGAPAPRNPVRTMQSAPGGQFQGTYGFSTGGVDSGKAVAGGAGGDWGGSMPRSLALARAVGATPSSQKRSRKYTASGGISDHWQGSTTSYATDLPTSGSAGDRLYAKVMAYLANLSGNRSIANIRSGSWHNINVGGYRYQVGWRVPGHYDHVHVGVKKL